MLLILATVLAASLGMAALLRCSVPVAVPTAIFTVILVLFAFGSVDLLHVGFFVVCALIAIGAVTALVLMLRREGPLAVLRWACSPALVVYALLLVVLGLSNRGLRFVNWDEFSHWGRVVAVMVREDALPPYADSDLIFRAYPPGLPLWEYFLANLRADFVEADVYLAYGTLTLALFLPFASRLQWRRPRHLLFLVAAALLLMTTFFGMDSVLIDPVLAMTFGYCVALSLLGSMDAGPDGSADGRRLWMHLGPALAVLALLKDTGVLLALIAVAVLVARIGAGQRLRVTSRVVSRIPTNLLHGAVGLAFVLVPTLVWTVIKAATDTRTSFETGTPLSAAFKALLNQGEPWRNQTTDSFVHAMTTEPITSSPFPLAFWGWFALALVLLACSDLVRTRLTDAASVGAATRLPVTTSVLVGSLVYAAAIWITYMTAFSEWEATRLASFPRYVKVYWLGALFVCVAVALWALGSEAVRRRTDLGGRVRVFAAVVLAVLLAVGQVPEIVKVLRRQHVVTAAGIRGPYDATAEAARQAGIGAGDRVWILDEHTTGFGFYVLSYELVESSVGGWSVGPLKDAEDIWTRDISVGEWEEEMADFDYLVVHHTERVFAQRYGSVFDDPTAIRDQAVFEVQQSDTGGVVLVEVTL